MKKSGYLARERIVRQEYMSATERVTQQLMLDTLQVTLHREFGCVLQPVPRRVRRRCGG